MSDYIQAKKGKSSDLVKDRACISQDATPCGCKEDRPRQTLQESRKTSSSVPNDEVVCHDQRGPV